MVLTLRAGLPLRFFDAPPRPPLHARTQAKQRQNTIRSHTRYKRIKDIAVPTTQIFCCFEWIQLWASYLAAPAAGMGGKPCRTAAAPKKLLHPTTHFEIVKKSADCPYKSTEIDEMINRLMLMLKADVPLLAEALARACRHSTTHTSRRHTTQSQPPRKQSPARLQEIPVC